jgi:hypothetical protein
MVFTWGDKEKKAILSKYYNFSKKIFVTGSPIDFLVKRF